MRLIPFETRLLATWYKQVRHHKTEMVCTVYNNFFFDVQLPIAVPKNRCRDGQIFEMLKVFWAVFSAKRTSVGAALRGL